MWHRVRRQRGEEACAGAAAGWQRVISLACAHTPPGLTSDLAPSPPLAGAPALIEEEPLEAARAGASGIRIDKTENLLDARDEDGHRHKDPVDTREFHQTRKATR